MLSSIFRLKIQQIESSCLFELSWGKGQQLTATVPYPVNLEQSYQQWQKAYLNFYRTALRGRVVATGKITPTPEEWRRQLVQAEAQLLFEFDSWLRSPELYEIRNEITQAAQNLTHNKANINNCYINLFITCNSLSLERLPWETWELSKQLGSLATIRIARTPTNIKKAANTAINTKKHSKVRIIAILGDNTGLNFQEDLLALDSLKHIAEIELVGWQPQQTAAEVKQQICQALEDERGWDILFFAGHSNETAITGGELAIAPKVAISLSEITPQLQKAQKLGLKFALFNSCNGLSLANALIGLGLSQVAIMREPIHNQVAQVFLVQFLGELAKYQDVHDALMATCSYLKQKHNLTYPSASLIPSLFCHPEAQLFRLKPWGWQQQIKQWFPTRLEAIALTTFAAISLLPPVHDVLLDSRILIQSIYRDVTNQIPPVTTPPVLLVEIDEASISKAGISDPHPMDRKYLAQIVDHITVLDAPVVAIDYLFDRQQPANDPILAQSIQNAVEQNNTWFIFAAIKNNQSRETGVNPNTGIADPNWSLQGYTNTLPQYLKLPQFRDCDSICPFTYLIAIAYRLHQESSLANFPQAKLNNQEDFRTQIINHFYQTDSPNLAFLKQASSDSLANFAQNFNRVWLRPINDFSLPPDVVYDRLPTWQLLKQNEPRTNYRINQQIIIIAPGGYRQAGITPGSDNFSAPLAVVYWRERFGLIAPNPYKLTGSEANAYMIHHLLTQRLVIPIPDLWAIPLIAILGKGLTLMLRTRTEYSQRKQLLLGLITIPVILALLELQLYITAEILLPWFFPSVTFLFYIWSSFNKPKTS